MSDPGMESVGQNFLATDPVQLNIGPYHNALPGPVRLQLTMDGEIIVHCEIENGFLHRGFEKICEGLRWKSLIPYADRLDPEASVFGELVVCMAVENLCGFRAPPRGQMIRVMLSELARISSHLLYIVNIAKVSGSDSVVQYLLRDREKVLDLFELLSGSRFSINFLRYGGVVADVSEGFLERVIEVCDYLQIRMKEYNDLLSFNQAFLRRTVNVGVILSSQARSQGITGPNLRATGWNLDLRKTEPYSGYEKFDFSVPVGQGEFGVQGDAHDRYLVRLREILESLRIIRQAVDELPDGEFCSEDQDADLVVPAGETFVNVESARGILGCHLVSTGDRGPWRAQFRTPSAFHMEALPRFLEHARLADFPLIVASLDIHVSEVDK